MLTYPKLPPVVPHRHSPPPSPVAGTRGDQVCAVVVTYCVGESLWDVIAPLLEQVAQVIIVDNLSDTATQQVLAVMQRQFPERIGILRRDSNNLAAAQNDGIRRALELEYGWVLLMDHDSVPAKGMVAALRAAWERLPMRDQVGIVAPRLTDILSDRPARYPQATGRFLCRRRGFEGSAVLDNLLCVVASGSLIPASVFRKVGLMDESLCIDYVDKDFCLRVVKAGLRVVAARDAELRHRLGRCRDYFLLGVRITTTNHGPDRCYYIFRNRLRTWRRHGGSLPAFVLYDVLAMGYDLLRLVCFEDRKAAKLHAIWRGFRDAVNGVGGSTGAGGQA